MRLSRAYKFFAVMLIIVVGAGLFRLKYIVEGKDRELHALQEQIVSDQRAIRVLEAEWAYLNSPDYLQDMATRYLGLRPMLPSQILEGPWDLPRRHSSGVILPPPIDFVLPSPRYKPRVNLPLNEGELPNVHGAGSALNISADSSEGGSNEKR